MSIFGSIMSKILGQKPAAAQEAAAPAGTDTTSAPAPTTPAAGQSSSPATSSVPTPGAPPMASTSTAGAAPQNVDVDAVLTEMASKNGQNLNWRQSIVDLMKLLGLDSSLQARKELAQELNYTGDTNDSASMNIWLHKQVMKKLAENGGKVPAELRD
ncbi:DUF3597 family protein [Pseudoroseomonas wenyumeiae]|uniref:DUF3597 domain-containing protein n=1 Tax=Teichococcus wenyumeiae TaxID=2478470 RepID=A0A3A9JLQ6_9PROT|nr:DUF3597 domain-containing protein [Pseudoroseomonas wenyumeiae]RKK06101.1 DUF3597 domain-containing protein [Pseudoroseomonas wenyumeiae]RMI25590.1 DUF3597 family protein [Pseudoroseomonas wenyumeiae]